MTESATTQTPSQGYVTMAYGPRKFFEMAVNLALSIKLNDPARPITLLYKSHDELPDDIAKHFDQCIAFENPSEFPGVTIKLAIYKPTPYDETFYIDADCYLMKRDMDRHWAKYGVQDFAISGDVVTSGSAYGCDVEKMIAAAGVNYFIDMNCGIIFYRKGEQGETVFRNACAYMREGNPDLIETRARRGDGLSDQPYFAAAMAKNNLKPVSYTAEEGTIMATTYRAADIQFDLATGTSQLKKPTGFYLLDRFWAKGWVQHDTTIAHFIEQKPLDQYQALSDWLRDHFGVPRFQFE